MLAVLIFRHRGKSESRNKCNMGEVTCELNRTEYKFAGVGGRGLEKGGSPSTRGEWDSVRIAPTPHCSWKSRDSRAVTRWRGSPCQTDRHSNSWFAKPNQTGKERGV